MIKQKYLTLVVIILSAILFVSVLMLPEPATADQTEDSAVIIMYHRFGEDNFSTTNITLEQFDAHLAELKNKKYNIVPLDKIVDALKNNIKLPPRTIAITIDDAYQSIYDNAWPRLKAANLPFTIFVSTEAIDRNIAGYMTWQEIRALSKDPLVSIGHHAHSHDHLLYIPMDKAVQDIEKASILYQKELGFIPDIFAYPYGEYSPELENILKEKGIKAAFGQFSGAANSKSDIYALPRFPFNEKYSDMARFKLVINAQALPVRDILPISPIITQNPPNIGFTVDKNLSGLSALSCYLSHMSHAADITRIGDNRIEVRFTEALPKGRSKINCTMPGANKRWYWFGRAFFVL
ncbi:MAG: polysaccharide deacetylase family protein [Emcibacter sp.]|nr:polysaccharide deacetylase family protein [Emcibacter sp.]